MVYPLYFNCNHITGQELFWWVEPEARKGVGAHLLDCLELAAMNAGAQSWAMIALDKVRPGTVEEKASRAASGTVGLSISGYTKKQMDEMKRNKNKKKE